MNVSKWKIYETGVDNKWYVVQTYRCLNPCWHLWWKPLDYVRAQKL